MESVQQVTIPTLCFLHVLYWEYCFPRQVLKPLIHFMEICFKWLSGLEGDAELPLWMPGAGWSSTT